MFIAHRSALVEALRLVGQVVERRNTIPICQNVLFERAGPGELAARVTDMDIEATIPFETISIDDGFRGFTVPAILLSDIIRKLPENADVKVEAADDNLSAVHVRSGRSKFRLQVLPESDFPTIQTGELPHGFSVSAAALAPAVSAVAFAVSTEETRHYLNGIFIHPGEYGDTSGLKLVATDGHRLSKRFIRIDDIPADMPGVIIPKKTVEVISKHLPKDGSVRFDVSENKIRLSIGDMTITSKLVDGKFPDYVRVIPSHEDFVEIESKPFVAAIGRVSTMSSGSNAMKMHFGGGTLTLSVSNPDSGNADDEVTYQGQADLTIGFNAKYVTEALNQLPEGTARLYLADAGSPAVLRSDGDHAENVIVLMPMRV